MLVGDIRMGQQVAQLHDDEDDDDNDDDDGLSFFSEGRKEYVLRFINSRNGMFKLPRNKSWQTPHECRNCVVHNIKKRKI